MGQARVHLGHALVRFEQDEVDVGASVPPATPNGATQSNGTSTHANSNGIPSGGITAYFTRRRDTNTPCEIPSMAGDLLIAADGINSTARKILYPTEGPPHFSGRMLWRGCLERDPYLTGARYVPALHPFRSPHADSFRTHQHDLVRPREPKIHRLSDRQTLQRPLSHQLDRRATRPRRRRPRHDAAGEDGLDARSTERTFRARL